MAISGIVVLIVVAFFIFGRQSLVAKNKEYESRRQYLEQRIEQEEQRKLELEELAKYMQTMKYYEEMAKSKLGLVYPNEIIFKPVVE